jgi:hypothetical protein
MSDWAMAGPEQSPGRLIEQDAVKNFGQMAQANYTNTLASKQQEELNRAKKIASAFSNPESTDPNAKPLTPDQQIYKDADKLRSLGYPEQAAKVVAEGALTATRLATEQSVKSQQHLRQIQSADDTLTAVSGYYDGVTSQEEFDRANGVVNAVTGVPSPLAGQTWSPHLASVLKNSQMTARQRALLPYEQGKLEAAAAAADALARARAERSKQYDAELALKREKAERDGKNGGAGGKDVGAPTRGELEQAARAVRDRYTELPSEDLIRYSDLIASDARAIRKQNPGVSQDEAIQRAIETHSDKITEVLVSEKVLGSEMLGGLLGKNRPQQKFSRSPVARPSAFPKAVPGMKYIEGQRYTLPNGKVGIRAKGGFNLVD